MQEQTLFIEALEKEDPAERAAFLDGACAADPVLRQRIEKLLARHQQGDSFLESPVARQACAGDTQGELPADNGGVEALDFLSRSDKPGALGRLGHYEVLEVLGEGGFGIVVRAYDEKLHRMIAIKIMSPRLAATSPARKRFVREARSSAAIRHENVVDIHAIEEQPVPFLVMEYVAGETLQQRLDRVGPLDPLEVLRIGVQVAHGLAAAHAMGKIHRDIKPANILLENGVDRVKITDFGLARAADDASLSQSGLIAGTPMYMAPEQAQGVALDHRADLFSFGSVLYVMCSGRPPFRASTTLAVLKRVADDTPRPIREIIPEVPEWLCDIITKLHAKNPNERYQSAHEVADVLSKYLNELQVYGKVQSVVAATPNMASEPTPAAAATSEIGSIPPEPPRRRRRLAVAAAVLFCLVGGLAFTEATGVTELRSTVIRIFTPDGTLIVEVNDPGVKVTVERDDGLVITGAGLEEIRLRPGNYKVQADRDGKPVLLDRELVSVATGGREVVRVKLESPPAPVVAKTDQGAFVLLAGGKERKFETLAEAVQGASAGDTIEIRGNGPFVTEPIKIGSALTIRARDGFRPVINLTVAPITQTEPTYQNSLQTIAPLVLEGLEFRLLVPYQGKVFHSVVVAATALRIANCRFVTTNAWCLRSDPINRSPLSIWEVRNCEFLCSGESAVAFLDFSTAHKLILENCVATARCSVISRGSEPQEPSLQLTRNTFRANVCTVEFLDRPNKARDFEDPKQKGKALLFKAAGNIFDSSRVFVFAQHPPPKILSPADAEHHLAQVASWKGERNLYSVGEQFLTLWSAEKGFYDLAKPVNSLSNWRQFWGTDEADSFTGSVHYQGGNLLASVQSAPEQLTPDDFRLRPDSAGYKAGKDGKDLGANVDLVGPGPAYERWKKTPEYQQWLKDTQQVTKAAEPKAFVLLGAKDVAERTFDTLADAVQGASDGDTIEIRGNGPFVTRPIDIKTQALTIRAGAGFRPVVTLAPEDASAAPALIATDRALTLEGLELQRMASDPPKEGNWRSVVFAWQAPLYVTNCRFQAANISTCVSTRSPICAIRNSQFIVGGGFGVVSNPPAGQRLLIENCLFNCAGPAVLLHRVGAVTMDSPQCKLTGNTFAGADWPIVFHLGAGELASYTAAGAKPLLLRAEGNLIDGTSIFGFTPGEPVTAGEVEKLLPRLITWQGDWNLFSATNGWLFVPSADAKDDLLKRMRTLADWRLFWKCGETESIEGRPRYEAGDLLAKLIARPEQLSPEDARLRPDSAGYRAGKDKKDLGADVDLVGPGPAYERWKKTPEYQQWLKETKQVTKAEASTAEPKAFVVLTGKGVEVRRYDTLAEAVRGAIDGDTIEIRGNGPYVTEPIDIKNQSLIIRAGDGYRPVLKLTAEACEKGLPLLETSAPLVLEGLELQQVSQTIRAAGGLHGMLFSHEAPLWMANCRLFMKDQHQMCVYALYCPTVELHNCEFFTNSVGLLLLVDKSSKCRVSNCVQAGGSALGVNSHRPGAREALVRLERNTLATSTWLVGLSVGGSGSPKHWELAPEHKLVRIKAADNILDAKSALTFSQYPETPPQERWSGIKGQEAETAFRNLIQWDDGRNVFAPGASSISWLISGAYEQPHGPKSLLDWKKFWGNLNADALEGQVRYQGGNLSGLLASGPDKLTAEHFRLRPDSAGYRAGKDGKDLGANIDLVGPGPAYERWKKTPAYQQWLKDSGQVKK